MAALFTYLVFFSMAVAAYAQTEPTVVYCNNSSMLNSYTDLLVITRRAGQPYYEPYMDCEFAITMPHSGRFMVTFYSVDLGSLGSPVVTVKESQHGNDLRPSFNFATSREDMDSYQQLATKSNSVYIRFQTGDSLPFYEGVVIRVTFILAQSCPSGWLLANQQCYGQRYNLTALKFNDAQKACNRMRANLLLSPSSTSPAITTLLNNLKSEGMVKYDSWIGLTDIDRQYFYYWLNKTFFYNPNILRCKSRGNFSTNCLSSERCAFFDSAKSPPRPMVMDSCSYSKNFICSMPLGGTDTFYSVPGSGANLAVILGSVFGSLALIGAVVAAIIICNRYNRLTAQRHRLMGSTNVRVGAPRVVVHAPPTSNHNFGYSGLNQPPSYPTQPPPSYTEVSGEKQYASAIKY